MRRRLSIALLLLLSACRPQVETVTVYAPAEDGDHYVNNAVPVFFKGNYYCMWQSSATDEDAPDTQLVYSRSRDGRRWAALPHPGGARGGHRTLRAHDALPPFHDRIRLLHVG